MVHLPAEAVVFLTSALPIIELRGAIPLGLSQGLHPVTVFILSFLGSLLPVIPLLWVLHVCTEYFRRIKIFDHIITWVFSHTRKKSKLVEEMGFVGLVILAAIPLPGAGVWSGCLAAYLFQFSWLESIIAITIGTGIAASIVMMASLGLIRIFGL